VSHKIILLMVNHKHSKTMVKTVGHWRLPICNWVIKS